MKNILISGASIAGPTLAYWLAHHGFHPTIVERNPAPRPGGQAIDIRGVALNLTEAMGILDGARARKTEMTGCSEVDEAGNEIFRSEEMTFSGGRFADNDVEILRDDLADLLLGSIGSTTEFIYGNTITALKDEADGVLVHFERGPPRRFDLVVGADGVNSVVRRLKFGDDAQFVHSLNHTTAIFTAPNFMKLNNWQTFYRGSSHSWGVYTARANTELRVHLGLSIDVVDEFRGNVDAQKQLMSTRFAHFGGALPELLEAMRATQDFYFGRTAQVRMDDWARDRVALVGDAGYGPTFMSGQGTSMAMVGAYVLARELALSPSDPGHAFRRYEHKLRYFVLRNQALVYIDREKADYPERQDAVQSAAHAIKLDGLSKIDGRWTCEPLLACDAPSAGARSSAAV
jgi:2-polyprenyl-6-methoxyphenol hydroxylase-like FAD-dependent oxidoreductase